MRWIRESPAHWDANKARIVGSAPPGVFDTRYRTCPIGQLAPCEWWRVEDDSGEDVGHGRLDDTWGDAEILVLVAPDHRRVGVGGFVVARLETEAGRRGLNYIYNVVPDAHPDPEQVTSWLAAHGFEPNDVGELRKKVAAPER